MNACVPMWVIYNTSIPVPTEMGRETQIHWNWIYKQFWELNHVFFFARVASSPNCWNISQVLISSVSTLLSKSLNILLSFFNYKIYILKTNWRSCIPSRQMMLIWKERFYVNWFAHWLDGDSKTCIQPAHRGNK